MSDFKQANPEAAATNSRAADEKTEPEQLRAMMASVLRAPELFQPSVFWDHLGDQHVAQLLKYGMQNFKRTVNMRYFNWGLLGLFAHQLLPLSWYWLRSPDFHALTAHVENNDEGPSDLAFGAVGGRIYAIVCALLYARVKASDTRALLDSYSEPRNGNPYLVRAFGKLFTQDMCNSVHEYYSSTEALAPLPPNTTVLEIGAGYGRLAHLFLTLHPGIKYWVVDIPPALYVSQFYLSETLPNRKIFRYRPFSHFDDVRAEVEAADVSFFMADQIGLLPSHAVDLVVCISNLHEMSRQQIDFYYDEIDRLSRGYFYTKQWIKSIATENGFRIRREEYPTKPSWQTVYDRRHDIQSWFFHALYRIHS